LLPRGDVPVPYKQRVHHPRYLYHRQVSAFPFGPVRRPQSRTEEETHSDSAYAGFYRSERDKCSLACPYQ
ncbi:hypothetical protein RCJ22_39020, partial [Vibrio sp. FNV 38]|nr:hypothetical protein [Vibrio sp. FNV 38]